MFIQVLIISIIIGYIFKGRLKNIDTSNINGTYLVFAAFFIEFSIVMLVKTSYISRGTLTFVLDLIMYMLLIIFIYLNIKNKPIVIMGAGFMLNALPIFLNGGAMPVSSTGASAAGLTQNVAGEGLYVLINSKTKLAFLGDVIALKYPRPYVVSLGDIIIAVGLMIFIIGGMKRKALK